MLYRFVNTIVYRSYIPTEYLIQNDKKIVYIPIPKIGCTSIKKAIFEGKADRCSKYADYMNIHSKLSFQTKNTLSSIQKDFYIIAFVRNPFDRLISCYLDKVRRPVQHNGRYYFQTRYSRHLLKRLSGVELSPTTKFADFIKLVRCVPDWLADGHFRSQHAFIYGRKGIKPNFIGRFESLGQDWGIIAERFKLPRLRYLNPTKPRDLLEWYQDKEMIELVYQRYFLDIEHWYHSEYHELLDHANRKSMSLTYK